MNKSGSPQKQVKKMTIKAIKSKTAFCTLTVLGCAAPLAANVVAADGNLLKNGDFEQGFAGWRKPHAMWRVEEGAGYGGSKGLVWECQEAGKREYPAQ